MFLVMGTLFITSLFRGRWFCGNLCPRGSYFDYGIIKISKKRKIPKVLSSMWVRIPVFSLMMAVMLYRISVTLAAQNTIELIGMIFVSICLVTTVIGTMLGGYFNTRSWCNACPMGTMQRIIGGKKYQLKMDHGSCVDCKKCEKVCPGLINIREGKSSFSSECSTCLQCVNVCPEEGALKYSFLNNTFSIGSIGVGLIFLIMFSGGIAMAKIAGHWENKITKQAYLFYMMTQGMMDKSKFDTVQSKNRKMERMIQMMKTMQKKENPGQKNPSR